MDERKVERIEQKHFLPHEKLIDYMRKRLEITNAMERNDAAGEENSVDIDKQERNLRTEKVRILDDIVFPAMADLVFFFKVYSEHPELKRYFEDDIKNLLGVKRNNPHKSAAKGSNYGFMFAELIFSILMLKPIGKHKKEDFRLLLLHMLYDGVLRGVIDYLPDVFNDRERFHLMFDDLARAATWIGMLSYRVKDEYEWHDSDKFKKDIENKSPERTFPDATVEDYLSRKIKGRKDKRRKRKKKKQIDKLK